MKPPKLMFYHDGRHPLIYMYETPMQKEEYEQAVDELVGTPVEALMFGLGDGRTFLHDTKVGELWGHNVEKWGHHIWYRTRENLRSLLTQGLDPLRIVLERAHEKGMLFYPVLLVQQGRGERGPGGAYGGDVRCSDFRFNNTHLEIGAVDGLKPGSNLAKCLDFAYQEVRDERFAILEETMTRYQIDGLELQLNYMPQYFKPSETEKNIPVMTGWVKRIKDRLRESSKEKGRPMELVVRVPASLEGCLSVGMDVKTWIEEGIVDAVVAQSYGGPELLDSESYVGSFVEAAEGTDCRIYGGLHSNVDSDRVHEASIEQIRGAACNLHACGVYGLYLAHWFGRWPYRDEFYGILRELGHPDIMAPKDKHYFVMTEGGRHGRPTGEPGIPSTQLPCPLAEGEERSVSFTISDDLPHWNQRGRVYEVILRIRLTEADDRDVYRIAMNGRELPDNLRRRINYTYRMTAIRYRVFGYWFEYRLPPEHWPVRGKNAVNIKMLRRNPDLLPPVMVRDVELETRYLMGKAFHRPEDKY